MNTKPEGRKGAPGGHGPAGPGGRPPFDLSGMKSKEEAIAILFENWSPAPAVEEAVLMESSGRTLADDYYALYNQPVVRSSQMDGIAVRSADFADGMPDSENWVPGTDYVRVDTGDDFDDAFDTVIQIEKVKILENGGVRFEEGFEFVPGDKVAPSGTNIKAGTQVGVKGTVLTPGKLAYLALGGHNLIKVYKKPVIGFIPTGSELVPAGSELKRGQNFDSNSIMVNAMLTRMGAEVRLHPIIRDDKEMISAAVESMLKEVDVLILNAGTSKGGEDYCVQYLEKRGRMLFHGVKAVPGRPMSITIIDGKPVINMSGPAFAAYYGCTWLMSAVIDRCLAHIEPMFMPTAEATLTAEVGGPPFFSAMTSFDLERDDQGRLLAAPVVTRGPGAKGMSAGLPAPAHYMTVPGSAPLSAGDRITLIIDK